MDERRIRHPAATTCHPGGKVGHRAIHGRDETGRRDRPHLPHAEKPLRVRSDPAASSIGRVAVASNSSRQGSPGKSDEAHRAASCDTEVERGNLLMLETK